MLSPDSGERAEATRSLDVANNTDNNHGGSLNDSGGLDDLTLVHLRARAVKVTHNVRHTSLVAHERGQVDRLLGVVARERLDLTAVARSALAREETKRAVARVLELGGVSI